MMHALSDLLESFLNQQLNNWLPSHILATLCAPCCRNYEWRPLGRGVTEVVA